MIDAQLLIGLVGSADPDVDMSEQPISSAFQVASAVGRLVGRSGHILVNGGLGGVMQAAATAAAEVGGKILVVSDIEELRVRHDPETTFTHIVPAGTFSEACCLIDSMDCVISIAGGVGTLHELCIAYRRKKPIILIAGHGGWTDRLSGIRFLDGRRLTELVVVSSASEAIDRALRLATVYQAEMRG